MGYAFKKANDLHQLRMHHWNQKVLFLFLPQSHWQNKESKSSAIFMNDLVWGKDADCIKIQTSAFVSQMGQKAPCKWIPKNKWNRKWKHYQRFLFII